MQSNDKHSRRLQRDSKPKIRNAFGENRGVVGHATVAEVRDANAYNSYEAPVRPGHTYRNKNTSSDDDEFTLPGTDLWTNSVVLNCVSPALYLPVAPTIV